MMLFSEESSIKFDGLVCETDHALICKAQLSGSRTVLIKFLPKVDLFFEELSRHYACDHSPYLPQLLHNFPPTSVGGIDFLGTSNIESFISNVWEHVDIAEIGALVIEYVEGSPITAKLKAMPREEQILLFIQIAEALRDLHSQGEYHGQLTLDQIVFDENSQQIKFIDLSYFQGKIPSVLPQLSPEHNPHSQFEVQAQSDIYMFALHFLKQLPKPSQKLNRLIQQSLEFDPLKRPSIDKVLETLSNESSQIANQPSRQRRIWSPIWVGMLACYGLFSTIAITHYYDNPLLKARTQILEASSTDTQQAVFALAEVRADANTDPSTAAILAYDIAQLKKNDPSFEVIQLTRTQIQNPVAVFALKKLPSLVTWNNVLTLGDWVQFENQTGYISRIDSYELAITTADQTEQILFSDSGLRYGLADSRVIIWKRPGNFPTILNAIDELTQLYQVDLAPGERQRILGSIRNGNITSEPSDLMYGTFEVSTFVDFLFKIESTFARQPHRHANQASSQTSYPLHYMIHFFNYGQNVPASNAYRYIESSIGIPIVIPEALKTRTIGPLEAFQVSWDEALDLLGFRWEIQERGRSSQIVIYDEPIQHVAPTNTQVSDL
jgi:serine/threonine protein kinase